MLGEMSHSLCDSVSAANLKLPRRYAPEICPGARSDVALFVSDVNVHPTSLISYRVHVYDTLLFVIGHLCESGIFLN